VVKFIVCKRLSKELVAKIIDEHAVGEIGLYTDEYVIYRGLSRHRRVVFHRVVRHSKREFARGNVNG